MAEMRWVEKDGAEWRWMHCSIIPIIILLSFYRNTVVPSLQLTDRPKELTTVYRLFRNLDLPDSLVLNLLVMIYWLLLAQPIIFNSIS